MAWVSWPRDTLNRWYLADVMCIALWPQICHYFETVAKKFLFFLCVQVTWTDLMDLSSSQPSESVSHLVISWAFSASSSVWSVLANCKWLTTWWRRKPARGWPWLSLVEIQSVNRLITLSKKVKRLKWLVYLSLCLIQFIIKNAQHLYIYNLQ